MLSDLSHLHRAEYPPPDMSAFKVVYVNSNHIVLSFCLSPLISPPATDFRLLSLMTPTTNPSDATMTLLNNRIAKLAIGGGSQHLPTDTLLCPGTNSDGTFCNKPGTSICSQCRLVKYCGRDHQNSHWRNHKVDCKSPYLSKDWKPRWAVEEREPHFVGADGPVMTAFGADYPRYLWGNVPAIDFLRIAHNEGVDASTNKDFNLAFAASGDLRNIVMTVNGLPQDYTGRCRILINDKDAVIAYRNALILLVLLQDRANRNLDDVVNSALHLWYSAALPPSAAAEFYHCVDTLFQEPTLTASRFETVGKGCITFYPNAAEHANMLATYSSEFDLHTALGNMRAVSLAPSRQDYLERHIGLLTPPHRTGFIKHRKTGVLAPFSQDVSKNFTEPNRTFFSKTGTWLMMDSANPLWGWDAATVFQSGQLHGVDKNDAYGCLFFHVQEQLAEFARRCADFHIDFELRNINAMDLRRSLAADKINIFGKPAKFDRIETSNVMDYLVNGANDLVRTFSPLINTQNGSSALCMSTMNWPLRYYGSPDAFYAAKGKRLKPTAAIAKMLDLNAETYRRLDRVLLAAQFMEALDVVHDDSTEFLKFLDRDLRSDLGLRLRTRNRIHTRRVGIPIEKQWVKQPVLSPEEYYNHYVIGGCDAPLRFLEFEPRHSN
jgi:hypothetical protein